MAFEEREYELLVREGDPLSPRSIGRTSLEVTLTTFNEDAAPSAADFPFDLYVKAGFEQYIALTESELECLIARLQAAYWAYRAQRNPLMDDGWDGE